jgi:hypothetical protein
MRKKLTALLLSLSTVAHGYWRAGNKLHHIFGLILALLVALIMVPYSLFRRGFGRSKNNKDEAE